MYCSSGLFRYFCIAVLYEYKEGGYMRIKRKVSISCLGGRLGICLLLAFVPQLLLRRKTVYVSFVTVYRYSRNSMNLYSLL